MFKYTNAFTNRSGDSLPGYFAKLFDAGGNAVDIFADASSTPISTVSGVANAALSDENGMFRWYVANGTYDIRFYDANDVFVSVETGVPMVDAGALTVDLSAETGATLVGASGGTVQASLNARPTSTTLAASGGAALVGAIATGGNATNLGVIYNRLHVWTEDYNSFQEAFNAAIARGAELHFRPGVTYNWPATGVSVTGKVKVVATGASLVVSAAITALTFATGADGSEWDGGSWSYTGSLTSGYNASSNAILVTGTRNGAAVAPTFIQNVRIKNATFDGFGSIAVEWRYARNCGDENLRVLNGGYAGVYCYSVDLYRSSGLYVNTLAGQLDTGNPVTSELNAYGFTATALTGGTPDRVRDPHSRDIIVDSPTIINVPTWHAIDTHGADGMIVKNPTIIDCRRGVVFTGLTDRGASNCKSLGGTVTNNLSPSATNANGTYKKGEAFWDIGPSSVLRNSFNRFEGCSCFGHGNPNGNDGAVTIANANDGFYGIADEESQRVGWMIGANISRATIDARTTNTRHASVNPSVARIEGNNIDLRIARWRTDARNAAVDTNVMVNGLVVVNTNTGGTMFFEDFDLTACTAGELVSTSGNTIAATLSGNYSITSDITMTGVDSTVTATVRFVRQGRVCSVQLPASGLSGTSNATSLTLTGVPASFRPSVTTPAGTVSALDAGANYVLAYSLIDSSGVITLTRDADGNTSNWTNTGTKSLRGGLLQWLAA
ncbi:hypothetical protein CDQ92_13115 [Sphingopyxis bauzanensis]|uniref:Uncharacterized protein n=1 Tax=Sphingopyxis bauzanensis TaxID=651663 RepID=A0A246JRW1_9SPHN|nr:hypothetical protein [Sphingopyxis bauzanensis]OWQ95719.1 hypothetical protein CDQ92_13115 [Sphingopyxis bauzanensis]GGJ39455.1 hypothetical protein GCM10011393_07080 [Sphingopyxis bauzanensis]